MRPKAPASPRLMHRSSTPSRSPGKRSERHIKIATVVLFAQRRPADSRLLLVAPPRGIGSRLRPSLGPAFRPATPAIPGLLLAARASISEEKGHPLWQFDVDRCAEPNVKNW